MARSTLSSSAQKHAGLIPKYRPSNSSTIPSTWADAPHTPTSLSSDPPASRGRDGSKPSTPNSHSSHAKLHKKNNSATNTPSLRPTQEDDSSDSPSPSRIGQSFSKGPSSSSGDKARNGIKPLLRRLTPQDQTQKDSLDLSRSAAENEGLGIFTSVERDRRTGDSTTSSIDRRTPLHHRSTSGTSQFSTATTSSGHNKPGSQYVHPMRQTPRPYTPPPSIVGSEYSGEVRRGATMPDIYSSTMPERPQRTTSFESSHTPRSQSALRLHTESLTKLVTSSQTNLASTASSFRPATDNMSMADTISPISRTSLDKGFRMRGRTNTDPATRAASIQAARRAFEEKEAAKDRKAEKQQLKLSDREARKRDRLLERTNSFEPEKLPYDSPAPENTTTTESIRGIDYSSIPQQQQHEKTDPSPSKLAPARQRRERKDAKSSWVLFLTWLRTRIFKLRRKVSNNGDRRGRPPPASGV